jgi:hypothetical protein
LPQPFRSRRCSCGRPARARRSCTLVPLAGPGGTMAPDGDLARITPAGWRVPRVLRCCSTRQPRLTRCRGVLQARAARPDTPNIGARLRARSNHSTPGPCGRTHRPRPRCLPRLAPCSPSPDDDTRPQRIWFKLAACTDIRTCTLENDENDDSETSLSPSYMCYDPRATDAMPAS